MCRFGCSKTMLTRSSFMENIQLSLHSQDAANDIWRGRYSNPLQNVKKKYLEALRLLESMRNPDYNNAYYPDSPPTLEHINQVKIDLLEKAMEFASTLYSSNNSPLALLTTPSYKSKLSDLRVVVAEVEKLTEVPKTEKLSVIAEAKIHDVVTKVEKLRKIELSPSENEVLLACYLMLGKELKGKDANKEYYSKRALQLILDLLFDQNVPYSTYLLACGRATLMEEFTERSRDLRRQEVLLFLKDIK